MDNDGFHSLRLPEVGLGTNLLLFEKLQRMSNSDGLLAEPPVFDLLRLLPANAKANREPTPPLQ